MIWKNGIADMRWKSAVSELRSLPDAIAQCADEVDSDPDLVVVFVSPHFEGVLDLVPSLIRTHIGDSVTLGCLGGGVIGAGREIEGRPGVAISTALFHDVGIVPFYIQEEILPDGDASPDAWETLVGVECSSGPSLMMLTSPFNFDTDKLIAGLDFAFPSSPKIGGIASGSTGTGQNLLFDGNHVYDQGALGIALKGNVTIDTVVAQGCRPIGDAMQITACQGNVLYELDGDSPIDILNVLYRNLGKRDQQLALHSLFIGMVMDPFNDDPKLGDFLIRNILGADKDQGALAISQMLSDGQTVQFHLRDAEASSDDLDAMLTKYATEKPIYEETGAMLFSCLGRGEYLYGRPDHDTDMFREKINAMPLTGFFCNGEIGPVGGTTFMHGYTSSFGIFRSR